MILHQWQPRMISVHLESCIFRDHQFGLLFFLFGKAFSFVSLLEELAVICSLCFAACNTPRSVVEICWCELWRLWSLQCWFYTLILLGGGKKSLWWDSSKVNLGISKFTTLYWQVCLVLRKPLTNSFCRQVCFWSWKNHWWNQYIGSVFGLEGKPL